MEKMNNMNKIFSIRQIIVSFSAFLILLWAFFENKFVVKIIITPFLICSIAIFFENLFLLLNKKKISNIFKYIFRISFFVYIIGFLIYATYYSIINKSYSLLIIVGIFILGVIPFFKKAFFNNK